MRLLGRRFASPNKHKKTSKFENISDSMVIGRKKSEKAINYTDSRRNDSLAADREAPAF
jgi:hypothetical protein